MNTFFLGMDGLRLEIEVYSLIAEPEIGTREPLQKQPLVISEPFPSISGLWIFFLRSLQITHLV